MKIEYEHVTETVVIEVDECWGKVIQEMNKKDDLNERRETRRHEALDQSIDGTDWLKSPDESQDDAVIRKETAREIAKAMMCLTEKQRNAFIAIHIHGYSVTDYAKKIGVDKTTLSKRLSVAEKKMKDRLKACNNICETKG